MSEIKLNFPRFPDEVSMTPEQICIACHGCCFYVTAPLDTPKSKQQKDLYSWYLHHQNVEIYVDHDKAWQLLFKTPCNHIGKDGMCGVYETRPDICRDYSSTNCSRVGDDHIVLFTKPEEMFAWLDSKKTTAKKTQKKSSKKKTAKKSAKKASKKKN
jgi:Fe-S-cluster containining protein